MGASATLLSFLQVMTATGYLVDIRVKKYQIYIDIDNATGYLVNILVNNVNKFLGSVHKFLGDQLI